MRGSKSIIGVMVLICFFILGTATAGRADYEDQWHSYIGTYFWLPGVSGNVKVKDLETNLDYDLGKSLNNAKFFAAVHYEGFGKNWGIFFDGMYGAMEVDKSHPQGSLPGTRRFKGDWSLIELAVPYRIVETTWVADVFVGVRYNFFGAELSIEDQHLNKSKNKDWLDPFFGARVLLPIAKNWHFGFRADIGGFGAGLESADLVLNGNASITWRITQLVSLSAGYRAYYLKYAKDNFDFDATIHGPWLGVGFSF
jgi:hypothetical protein